jgi:hypothetical protein
MSAHVVTAMQLNLRSAPNPKQKNIIAVLAQGTEVTKINNSPVANWWEIDVEIAGTTVRGFVNSKHLGPVDTAFPTAAATAGRLPPADLGSRPTETRSVTGARAYSIGETGKPGRASIHPAGKTAGIIKIIDWLDVGNSSYLRWQGTGGKTFCNVYVYDVCDTAGCYLPRVWWKSSAIASLLAGNSVSAKYGKTVEEMRANYIFNWLVEYGEDFGWKRVFTANDLQSAVNSGDIGIICAQRTDMERPGHIQIIAPEHGVYEANRAKGKVTQPLQSNAGASNFTYGFLGSNWWLGSKFRQFGFWVCAV